MGGRHHKDSEMKVDVIASSDNLPQRSDPKVVRESSVIAFRVFTERPPGFSVGPHHCCN